jgi:hypothetical protein
MAAMAEAVIFCFHSIRSAYWTNNSTGNVFLDNIWQGNEASVDDLIYSASGGANYSLYLKWYLNVSVKNASTNLPVSGATVTAVASGSGAETVSASTDTLGNAQLALTNYQRYGTTGPATINYTQYTPHNVTVSKAGYVDSTINVTMDNTKSQNFFITPSIADVVAPTSPSGLSAG